jgi:hypothetical protein
MALTARIIGSTICLVTFFATPLSGEVFAQSPEIIDEGAIQATSSATTTETVLSSTEESWYKSEQIFGTIDVGDFVVGPGRTEIEVRPGETVVQEITVTNRISDNRTFELTIEDISGGNDPRNSVTLSGDERGPYSVRDYISFPHATLTLALGERARIPVTITIPPNAEPGGYYGTVLISTVRTPGNTDDNAPRSPIIARVGSLFFVTVAGDTLHEGVTKEVSTINNQWWYEKGPIELGILYENTGSVHLNPYGEISITNMFGEEVGFVELEPWFVLPKSLRLREVSWDREFLLGRYTVTARINRGYDDIVDEVTTSFWVMPWKIVGGMFLVLFIIIFSLRAFFRTFEFKRKGD